MAGYKISRIAADLQRELSVLIRTVKDPRVSSMLSIVKVDVSGDLSYAKIYVSAIEGMERTKQAVEGLKSAAGYLKRELGGRLSLRKLPALLFIADDSIQRSAHIAEILDSLQEAGGTDES